jgi:hypothetical protein
MDFEMMTVYDKDNEINYWDFKVKKGRLETVDHSMSEEQRAIVATFLQRGTVPQMPTLGNQWAELETGDIVPTVLNSQVKDSIISLTGAAKFVPKYSNKDGKLIVEVVKA